jgi:broad specificity phosphatase PhoE
MPNETGETKTVILLRHGQSEFNVHITATRRDPGIADPRLTEHGHVQAELAARALRGQGIARIVVSPYSRALQTAEPVARLLDVPVFVHPIVRERYGYACDIGTPRSELRARWPDHDFSPIDEVWWPSEDEPADSVVARASAFRAEMAARRDWSDTLVISHWGFILCMTGQNAMNGQWLRCDPTEPPPSEIIWRS